jgi:hypothetical protein
MKGLYELVGTVPPHTIAAFDGKANVWRIEHNGRMPAVPAVAISRGAAALDVEYDDPRALVLETFDDLGPYAMSDSNRFEQYVIGNGKMLTPDGPVRDGVSQSFVVEAAAARVGTTCGVYTAVNRGGAGGWCAKGRRFAAPMDLSRCRTLAFWLHGDGKGEKLRFQFRDTAGRHADWLVPIDFIGWQLRVFRTADAADFDWRRTEYVIFYFNDLPAGATCVLKLDDLRAFARVPKPAVLSRPVLSLNGRSLCLPVDLAAGEGLTLDSAGRLCVWQAGRRKGKPVQVERSQLVLRPGANEAALQAEGVRTQGWQVWCHVVAGPTVPADSGAPP